MYVLIAILLISVVASVVNFLFLSSSFVCLTCDLMTISSVIICLDSILLCVCIFYRFLVCGYSKVYMQQSLYV